MSHFGQWVRQIANRQVVSLLVKTSDILEFLEGYSRLLVVYAWLARHYPELCESDGTIQALRESDGNIIPPGFRVQGSGFRARYSTLSGTRQFPMGFYFLLGP
ncbi:MAG: hypothetical protein HY774_25180 [Acidobacteria bacterium]|nr:hypothetical protein [Acidobacteriota bacterium]